MMHQESEGSACKTYKRLLFDYVSDCTDETQSEQIRTHLEHCASCRKEYHEICTMLSVLQEPAEAELPKGFQLSLHQKLVAAADEMQTKKERSFLGWLEGVRKGHAWRVAIPMAACVALVLGVYSGGLYDQWKEAGTIPATEGEFTEAPAVTMAPTPEPEVSAVTPEPAEDTPVVSQKPAVTPQPKVVREPAKAKTVPTEAPTPTTEVQAPAVTTVPREEPEEIQPKEEPLTDKNEESETHTPMMAMAEEPAPAVASARTVQRAETVDYLVSVTDSVESFLDGYARNLTENTTTLAENQAILHFTEPEWEDFSHYISTADAKVTSLWEEEPEGIVVVEIQGFEG